MKGHSIVDIETLDDSGVYELMTEMFRFTRNMYMTSGKLSYYEFVTKRHSPDIRRFLKSGMGDLFLLSLDMSGQDVLDIWDRELAKYWSAKFRKEIKKDNDKDRKSKRVEHRARNPRNAKSDEQLGKV